MKNEIWKPITGYENRYDISNFGRIKSKSRIVKNHTGSYISKEIIMKQQINQKGYLRISLLNKNGKRKMVSVHRIVANEFIENNNNLKEINHKDFNKQNNNVENLEWCDRNYNLNYGDTRRRNVDSTDYKSIGEKNKKSLIGSKNNIVREFNSVLEAAKYLNVSNSAVSKGLHGKIKLVHGWSFSEKC